MLTRCNLKVLTLANHVDRNHDITSVFGAFDFLKRHKFKEGLISKVAMAFFDAANKVYMSSFVILLYGCGERGALWPYSRVSETVMIQQEVKKLMTPARAFNRVTFKEVCARIFFLIHAFSWEKRPVTRGARFLLLLVTHTQTLTIVMC